MRMAVQRDPDADGDADVLKTASSESSNQRSAVSDQLKIEHCDLCNADSATQLVGNAFKNNPLEIPNYRDSRLRDFSARFDVKIWAAIKATIAPVAADRSRSVPMLRIFT
jgi:hypothetical protein